MNKDDSQIIIVAGLIVNEAGEVLMLKRNKELKRAAGKWELASGKLLYGEEPLDALPRVINELTGLNVQVGKLIHSRSLVSERNKKHIVIFYNEASEIEPKKDIILHNNYETSEWVDVNNLQHYELEVGSNEAIDKFKRHLSEVHKINKIDDNVATSDTLVIYTDGGSRGNPGPSASGFVIMNEAGEVIEEGGEYLGITTNNQAEYQAVKLALQAAKKHNAKKIHFRIDSLLVVNQMNGVFKIKSKDLWPIHEDIKKLSSEYKEVTYEHVYREANELADAKVNEVLDSRED